MKTHAEIARAVTEVFWGKAAMDSPHAKNVLAKVERILLQNYGPQLGLTFSTVQDSVTIEPAAERATQVPFSMPKNPSCGHCGSAAVKPSRMFPGYLTCNSCGSRTKKNG